MYPLTLKVVIQACTHMVLSDLSGVLQVLVVVAGFKELPAELVSLAELDQKIPNVMPALRVGWWRCTDGFKSLPDHNLSLREAASHNTAFRPINPHLEVVPAAIGVGGAERDNISQAKRESQ